VGEGIAWEECPLAFFEILSPRHFAYILAATRTILILVGYDPSREGKTPDLREESASRGRPHQFFQSEHF
jgi:hypothetical protein